MKKVFISCGSLKLNYPAKAKDMYQGCYFKKELEFARTITDDNNIFILSAKYGLLGMDEIIEPYNTMLSKQSREYRNLWGELVINQLKYNDISQTEEVISLCPAIYNKPLLKYFTDVKTPLKGLEMGYAMQFMKNEIERNRK